MSDLPDRRVVKKILIGFNQVGLDALNAHVSSGVNQTQAVHDSLVQAIYNPFVEAAITSFQETHHCNRRQAIESIISEWVTRQSHS